jgi:hypothetical protein
MFIGAQEQVYEGMIVGEASRENDINVNVVRAKQLTNIRSAGADEKLILTPKVVLTLEKALEYIAEDELVEITPAGRPDPEESARGATSVRSSAASVATRNRRKPVPALQRRDASNRELGNPMKAASNRRDPRP